MPPCGSSNWGGYGGRSDHGYRRGSGRAQVAHGSGVVGVVGDHEGAAAVLSANHRVRRVGEVGGQADLAEVGAVGGDVEGERVAARRRAFHLAAPHVDLADVRVHEEQLQRRGRGRQSNAGSCTHVCGRRSARQRGVSAAMGAATRLLVHVREACSVECQCSSSHGYWPLGAARGPGDTQNITAQHVPVDELARPRCMFTDGWLPRQAGRASQLAQGQGMRGAGAKQLMRAGARGGSVRVG